MILAGYWHVSGELAFETILWESKVPPAFRENGITELFYTFVGKASLLVSKFLAAYCFYWLRSNSLSNVWLTPS